MITVRFSGRTSRQIDVVLEMLISIYVQTTIEYLDGGWIATSWEIRRRRLMLHDRRWRLANEPIAGRISIDVYISSSGKKVIIQQAHMVLDLSCASHLQAQGCQSTLCSSPSILVEFTSISLSRSPNQRPVIMVLFLPMAHRWAP